MPPLQLDGVSFEERFGLNSQVFTRVLGVLLKHLQQTTSQTLVARKVWEQFFGKIHRNNDMTDTLFVKHSYLFFLVELILCRRFFPQVLQHIPLNVTILRQNLADRGINLNGSDFYSWVEEVQEISDLLVDALKDVEFDSGDLFYAIYQGMTSPAARHALGEFYTPPPLARLMLEKLYKIGLTTLDPACGSGTFLVEMIGRIKESQPSPEELATAIVNLYGFDVHPLAVLVAKANILLQFPELPPGRLSIQIHQVDALFPDLDHLDRVQSRTRFDLVIGNPPWLVLNGIESEDYKERVKGLARELGIMQGGKFATHTELTALFYYRCRDLFLKEGGWIFFVATAGFLSGDQHSRFRQFKGFANPFAWRFDQDIFRVHNICLGLQKMNQPLQTRLRVQVTDFQCLISSHSLVLVPELTQIYVPYNLKDLHSENDLVRRLIPESEICQMIPRGHSPYLGKFYQGASLVPRSLIFVIPQQANNGIVTITPDTRTQCKPPWDFHPFDSRQVEQDYIFQVAKSTEIVPFSLVSTKMAFLPIDSMNFPKESNTNFVITSMKPLARFHFEYLNALYRERQKRGASVTDLWARLNYNHGLATFRQNLGRKVVFRGIGGYTQAAIVGREVIVDTSCYFYAAESEGEAYYLLAILNSLAVSQDLRKRGSTGASGSLRNLHKKPLEYDIPIYDSERQTHAKLAMFGQEMELKVRTLIHEWQQEELPSAQKREDFQAKNDKRSSRQLKVQDVPLRPHSIHNRILKDLSREFEQLDVLVLALLQGHNG
ncbi:MAG: putative endonuclease [Promethearchaeota archaeon CR_4]|nr:MAG: putative endonuclease [Candidatus Lokiarchaeota archaeon CR_4]